MLHVGGQSLKLYGYFFHLYFSFFCLQPSDNNRTSESCGSLHLLAQSSSSSSSSIVKCE